MTKQGLSYAAIGIVLTAVLYAADWQREQDAKIAGLDKLIVRQQVLLEMQVKLNELKATLAIKPQPVKEP